MRRHALALFPMLLLASHAPAQAPSDLRDRIEAFAADLADLGRRYDVPMSPERRARLRERYTDEQQALAALDFAALPRDARVDWLLLDNHVRREIERLAEEVRRDAELTLLESFAPALVALGEAQRRLEPVDGRAAADTLTAVQRGIATERARHLRDVLPANLGKPQLLRAAERLAALRRMLASWFQFHDGYDPQFSWWVRRPYSEVVEALEGYERDLRNLVRGGGDGSLVGDPIGAEALQRELAFEWIPYTPDELVSIAEREFATCAAEALAAARAMGCASYAEALERVKQRHRPPGSQPALIAELAREAIDFLQQRDLVTIPSLAKECWRMSMMSPEAQRVSPFFLGGETIQVSFPTDAMSHAEKLQSLRSNNEHFCRATVHHELIPGHWLQQYSQARWRRYRSMFRTPFWMEGWALYWEMRLYDDLEFPRGPEDRIGMLYWRKHRCARIVFSLNFHLGKWTGAQCVDYLVEQVGHERAAAEGEVRRSVGGGYGPLYQAAYMLGGLQLRALHRELVRPGSAWTEKRFHDAVLQQNSIPIAAVRAALGEALPGKELGGWRFAAR
ncbi:MAG: DUF885 family protein [Planctomycetes bacterium]|nr:DUF885 family protein [Planctomycetota bacterium]